MLLLVIDIADPGWEDKRAEVLAVLEELGASRVPRIEIHNKIDLTEDREPRAQTREAPPTVRVSAADERGFGLIFDALATSWVRPWADRFAGAPCPRRQAPARGTHQKGRVEDEVFGAEGQISFASPASGR